MDTAEQPLAEAIDAFIETHSMSPVTFGRRALNDPHFVAQLKGGRRCWPETEAKVRTFIRDYRSEPQADAA